jgi:glycosyltransferase involved in cell wall biosynthesis
LNKNKIKILYVCRLFNGLETSVDTKLWSPTGVPTIYRMIEALDKNERYHLELIFTSKEEQRYCNKSFVNKLKIKGISSRITVLSAFGHSFGRFGKVLCELFHIGYILKKVLFNGYDIFYTDHANIFSASIISRFKITPVLFRVMGVYPMMRRVISHSSNTNSLLRWCYKSPFSSVICTQDGSGIETWLECALAKTVPVYKLINGVDYIEPSMIDIQDIHDFHDIPIDKFIILYIGKLEVIKGIYDFIEGFLMANEKINGRLHAVIIGHGDQSRKVSNLLEGRTNFTLIPRVKHNEIFKFHAISDLYISPNRLANLTNSNLEAMQSGACIAIPESQLDTGVDLVTDKMVTNTSVYRYNFPPTPSVISQVIINLYHNSDLRKALSENIVFESSRFITSWNERIKLEVDILDKITK